MDDNKKSENKITNFESSNKLEVKVVKKQNISVLLNLCQIPELYQRKPKSQPTISNRFPRNHHLKSSSYYFLFKELEKENSTKIGENRKPRKKNINNCPNIPINYTKQFDEFIKKFPKIERKTNYKSVGVIPSFNGFITELNPKCKHVISIKSVMEWPKRKDQISIKKIIPIKNKHHIILSRKS